MAKYREREGRRLAKEAAKEKRRVEKAAAKAKLARAKAGQVDSEEDDAAALGRGDHAASDSDDDLQLPPELELSLRLTFRRPTAACLAACFIADMFTFRNSPSRAAARIQR